MENDTRLVCRVFKEQLDLLDQLPNKERYEVLYQVILFAFNQIENNSDEIGVSSSMSKLGKTVFNLLKKDIICKRVSINYGGRRQNAGRKPTVSKMENVETEIVKPQNKFVPLTDDPAIRTELEKPTSALSVFLETGSGYDELTPGERDFADRGDVRKNCTWHKEIQAATRAMKTKLPSEQEVLEYARQQNSIAGMGGFACSDEEALNFYDYYSGIGWVMPNDSRTPIVNWKPFLRKWVRNPLRPQNKMRMSIKDMKEMQNEIEVRKILKGER